MDKQPLYIIIGVLAGVILGIFIARYAVNTQNYPMMNMMGMGGMMQRDQTSMMGEEQGMQGMGMSMNQMSSTLAVLKGEDFDRMFITLMIDHHQGAIDMAKLALSNSEKDELKDLANDIISAQTKEIEMMKGWLDSWY